MIEYLLDVEKRLPELLKSMDGWATRFVTYERPHVERLFRQDGDNRIYLHRIHKCKPTEAFLHVHPWPSAMRVVQGFYRMKVGVDVNTAEDGLGGYRSDQRGQGFVHAANLVIGEGSLYEMTNSDAMHSVAPLTDTTLSLMVTGRPWERSTDSSKRNPDLDHERAQKLLEDFRLYYPG